jgi:hypothetical protein
MKAEIEDIVSEPEVFEVKTEPDHSSNTFPRFDDEFLRK